jgi:hypothetical protein
MEKPKNTSGEGVIAYWIFNIFRPLIKKNTQPLQPVRWAAFENLNTIFYIFYEKNSVKEKDLDILILIFNRSRIVNYEPESSTYFLL